MIAVPAVLSLIVGYLIGSIMTAVKIAKSKSVDIRSCGSGNAGSTNVLRTFGWKWGLICLTCDCAKGALSVLFGRLLGYIWLKLGYMEGLETMSNLFGCFALLGAIFGHLLPIFYNFRGDKCVAVALGGLLVLAPLELLAALVIAVILILITRMVSVGSIVGTLLTATFVVIANWGDIPLTVLMTIIVVVIITAHLPNIQRILEGRERRLERIEWERNFTGGAGDAGMDTGTVATAMNANTCAVAGAEEMTDATETGSSSIALNSSVAGAADSPKTKQTVKDNDKDDVGSNNAARV